MRKIILMTICAIILNFSHELSAFAKPTLLDTELKIDEGLKIPEEPEELEDLKDPGNTTLKLSPTFSDPETPGTSTWKPPAESPLTEATFDVNTVLNLGEKEQTKLDTKSENSPLVSFVLKIMNYATAIMGTIAMILLIIAGFMMMFSTGDQQIVDKAKDVVKYAIIGLVVAFLSYIIVIFIQSLFIPAPSPKT